MSKPVYPIKPITDSRLTLTGDIDSEVVKEFSPMVNAKVMNNSQEVQEESNRESTSQNVGNNGGSVLGSFGGYDSGLGYKTKKEWIKELNTKHNVNFLALQETKTTRVTHMDVKFKWGNSNYQYVSSDSVASSGGILCVWEPSVFKKDYVMISDNFIAIYGTWLPSNSKILFVAIYAPQQASLKRVLWDYVSILLGRWNGEAIIMRNFNEARSEDERRGSVFNPSSARTFNHFISSSGLVDVKLEGYAFTWSHPLASKMSKLDRFLVSEGILSLFPSITAICLDRHLSDHRPILLCEVHTDFGPIPFRFYHSWFSLDGFDDMAEHAWNSFSRSDANGMIRFKKKLEDLKIIIRKWVKDKKLQMSGARSSIKNVLGVIDKDLDRGVVSDTNLYRRLELKRQLHDTNQLEARDSLQKSKVKWSIEGDENSRFFHSIINKKRSQLSIRGVFVDDLWITEPGKVKDAFLNHFKARFQKPASHRLMLNFPFNKQLSSVQVDDLERCVSRDEIRMAAWNCRENKSPVEYFFENGSFPKGCNSSFIALIPKVTDAKFVTDFRPISLIGCIYKVVTKILANRLALVILDLVSDTQYAFVANRQILDGPFILNEVLNWCKRKKKQAMFFKVDFAKAYGSVRWDYLLDVLQAFGLGQNWCKWVRGTFRSVMTSVLVNGSPSTEFPFYCGLKKRDPLSLYLFILIMESLHMSFSRAVNEGLFKGIQLHGSISISHLFYADDAMFIGEWSDANLKSIVNILKCFFLASGLKINIHKSQVLGVVIPRSLVVQAAASIGCAAMQSQFRYLGVMVGECMSRHKAWTDTVLKLRSRLCNWKVKTLSIGGRLTILKSVLGASPLYNMSIYKVPRGVLKSMETIRSKFFNGADYLDKKITWAPWGKVLASKKNGGLGVSSFHALNRAFLLKWIWRFISQDGSLWFRVIQAFYGPSIDSHLICDKSLQDRFPRMFALEMEKEVSVAVKMGASVVDSFRRTVRNGTGRHQMLGLNSMLESVSLSSAQDRWICNLSGDGEFWVKEVRNILDDLFLPAHLNSMRWVKYIPIKINVFAWRARRDCLPTRSNLIRRGVPLVYANCLLCQTSEEDIQHVLFRCDLAQIVLRKICRWWELDWQDLSSFSDWHSWFSSIRLPINVKSVLEGVFCVAWWVIWVLRNRTIFVETPPRRSVIFDDIVSYSSNWCSSRCSRVFSWETWLKNPYLISL
nr:RNA-directed DNA polymerase, eukaryota [Tanacetum cinerariifolium]